MNFPREDITKRIETDKRKYEPISQLAKQHLMDQSHTTTDEELKNPMVELSDEILIKCKPERVTGGKESKA